MQLGPTSRIPATAAAAVRRSSAALPSGPVSPKPDVSTIAARQPARAASATAAWAAAAGTDTRARSTDWSRAGTARTPSTSPAAGLTGTTRPRNPPVSAFLSRTWPSLRSSREAPYTATERGSKIASTRPIVRETPQGVASAARRAAAAAVRPRSGHVESHRQRVEGRQRAPAAGDHRGRFRLPVEAEVGQPIEQDADGHRDLHTRELLPEAHVRAGRERQVLLGRPPDVETVGVGPAALVAVGRAEAQGDVGP